jgi:hypothetical protein
LFAGDIGNARMLHDEAIRICRDLGESLEDYRGL